MDSTPDSGESYDLGYQPSSSSVDQTDNSPTKSTVYSTISSISFMYSRTYSEASAFSEHTDDSSCSEMPSPVCWPAMKSPRQAALSKLGMGQHKHNTVDYADNQEPVDLGEFNIILFSLL